MSNNIYERFDLMNGYSDEIKEEIRASNDIVDVVSKYVPLKKRGRIFFGLCPFHSEKSASFSVKPDNQFFYCFGCHAGGDVFSFISKIENLSFKESVEFLAERAGIKLPTLENLNTPQEKLKEKMYQIHSDSTIFYHERLYKPLAKIAQDYVKKRKLDNKTLQSFKIGYSGERNELYQFLKSKGYTDKEIESTGLCFKTDRGDYIDKFRKRLMFPIMDSSGRAIAFGGRRLDENQKTAKYLNSNESLIFLKKNNLFALNLAKKSDSKTLILVEGYMDVISLHQRGINTAVASLGTALTEEQGKLIRRYSDKVVFSYDSDEAGQNAIARGLEILEKLGVEGKVLQMEGAKDPDEYIIKYGSGRFNLLVENAISLIEFKTKRLRKDYNLEIASDKIKFLKQVSKLISGIDSEIEREIYISKISETNGISKEAIYAEINKLLYKKDDSKVLEKSVPVKKFEIKEVTEIDKAEYEREKMILYFLIKNFDEVGNKIISKIKSEDFKVEKYKKVYNTILEIINNGNTNIYNSLSNIEDSDFQSNLSEIMFSEYEISSVDKFLNDILNNYEKNKLSSRKLEILKLIKTQNLSKSEVAELENELSEIITRLAKIK